MKKPLKELVSRKSIAALLYIALGVLLIVFRDRTPEILCRLVGAGLCIIGLYNLVYHIVQDELLIGFPSDIILMICGMAFVFFSGFFAVLLATLLGLFMIIKSIFGMQEALISKKRKSKTWVVDLVYTSAAFIMGLFLVINPLQGSGYLSLVMGLVFIIDGVLGLITFLVALKLDSKKSVSEEDCVITAEAVVVDEDKKQE